MSKKKKWRKIQIQKRILRWQPFWKEKEPQADERSLLECASNMLWPSKQGHFAWTLINITNQYSVPGKCLSTIYDYICTLYHWFQQYYQWHYQACSGSMLRDIRPVWNLPSARDWSTRGMQWSTNNRGDF